MSLISLRSTWSSNRVGTAVLLTLALQISACFPSRSFEVKGRIVEIIASDTTIYFEHEAIPGYMPAMTMAFRINPLIQLDRFKVGDAVSFKLVVSSQNASVAEIRKIPDGILPLHPAAQSDPLSKPLPGNGRLAIGQRIPSITLINQDSDSLLTVDPSKFVTILTFIYTRCPLPNYCPLLSSKFRSLLPKITALYGDQARLLSISFDPQYDSPAVLKDYSDRYTQSNLIWEFVTGTPSEIDTLATAFGVYRALNNAAYAHNLVTALVDKQGRLVRIWQGNNWSVKNILSAVETMTTREGTDD